MSGAIIAAMEAAGAAYGIHDVEARGSDLIFRLPVRDADGRERVYNLIAEVSDRRASVRELEPELLPAFCPNRHINADGSFCMNWQAVDQITLKDHDGITRWWDTLLQFLRLQHRATRRRKWPEANEWAHGAAAVHQLHAQRSASALGAEFLEDLKDGLLTIEEGRLGSNVRIRVYRKRRWLYSVWKNHQRAINLRRPCFCGNPERKVLKSCAEHADDAVKLALALSGWKQEEDEFWKSYEGRQCCLTLKECPLAEKATEADRENQAVDRQI